MSMITKNILVGAAVIMLTACGDKAPLETETPEAEQEAIVSADPNSLPISDPSVEDVVLDSFDTVRTDQANGVIISGSAVTTTPDGWNEIKAKSVRVIDGDTVEILIDGAQSERVRLIGIDAPESKQDFGQQSTSNLQECIGDKPVKVIYKEKDQYDRLLGKVIAGSTDCNFYQVATGMAWHYKQFAKSQPSQDQLVYSDAEKMAKTYSKGIWVDPNIVAPWDFRKSNK